MELDVELSVCRHHVTLVSEPRSYFVECPWCPDRDCRAIVSINGVTV